MLKRAMDFPQKLATPVACKEAEEVLKIAITNRVSSSAQIIIKSNNLTQQFK